MNIVLIGYRGTGKSVVGACVAARLGLQCVSMDAEIVARAGMPIPDLVAQSGWPAFRDLESVVARDFAGRDGLLIDCGGGVIERPDNIEALRANGLIIWLQASVATIVARIHGDTQRPALTSGKSFTEEVAEVLERREPKYRSAAHETIATDGLTPEQVADRIVAIYQAQ
jgi:shikimate kinase